MAIIDQEGLLKGKRLRKCSATARWRWPYLFILSNGFARIELDYESIAEEFVSFREFAPTPDELRETFSEFRANHLLFVYVVNDQEWGQWDCRRSWLKDYKTSADNCSPKPPEPEYQQWLREQHGEDWREFHWSREAILESLDQTSPKTLPNLSNNLGAERYGVGVGVGNGEGEGKERTGPQFSETVKVGIHYEPELDGSEAFQSACQLYPKPERDHPTQVLYFEAIVKISKQRDCSQPEAIKWLNERITRYAERQGKFAVGFEKFLRKEIYLQPETAWGSSDVPAEVSPRKLTSATLSERIKQGAAHAN